MAGYLEQSLGEGETVLAEGRFPTVHWIMAWACLILLGALIFGIVIFAAWAIRMKTTEFAVTDRRVVLKQGLIHRTTEELAIETVEGVGVDQSILGRIFGYGRLVVRGTGEARIDFPPMAHPIRFRQAIEEGRMRASGRADELHAAAE